MSRFQKVNILYLPRQRRQKRTSAVKPMSQYPNFSEDQYPYILFSVGNIQYPDFKLAISPAFWQYPISSFEGYRALFIFQLRRVTFWTRKSTELPELSDSEDEEEEGEDDQDGETVSESNVELSITGNLIKKTLN